MKRARKTENKISVAFLMVITIKMTLNKILITILKKDKSNPKRKAMLETIRFTEKKQSKKKEEFRNILFNIFIEGYNSLFIYKDFEQA